jgi:putative transposase
MTLSRVTLAVVKRIERIRLYPRRRQAAALAVVLDVTRDLYNALLQQRRDAFRLRKVRVTAKMQYAELTELRAEDERLRAVYREAEDAVLHRLDLAMAAVFRRCKRGEKAGYPRFKSRRRRMLLAADNLSGSGDSISVIASSLGYESETAARN